MFEGERTTLDPNSPYYLEIIAVGKIALAMLLSGLIGFEREVKDHPAGLRTHMFVGGGAALFMVLSDLLTRHLLTIMGAQVINLDPSRLIQAVVTGISFLGAGAIIKGSVQDGTDRVKGLTTAASILFVSGIGIAVAGEQYIVSIGSTLLAFIVLDLIHRIEKRMGTS